MTRPSALLPILGILYCLITAYGCSADGKTDSSSPRLVFSDWAQLQQQKQAYQSGESTVKFLVEQLQETADGMMETGPFSVVHKEQTPPSGDKHDYMSQGPYWWPDTTKADGLPYIRRDGEVNPERATLTDRQELAELTTASEILSRAYYYTGEEAYARRLAKLLSVWFVEAATRMNPHLEYGQAIPGRTEGRGIGIIETRNLGKITDAVALIRNSPAWTPELENGMQEWMGAYLDWLLNSKKGQDEAVHPNNHGTWYDVQAVSLALFTGRDSLARSILEKAKVSRFDEHLEADGAQPRELARTLSFNYSAMNLLGLFQLARLGESVDVDLWHYSTPEGASLQDALDFLLPAALGEEAWLHQQIKPITPDRLIPHLAMAAQVYDPAYAATAQQLISAHPDKAGVSLYLPLEVPGSVVSEGR
jgi:hypothetical protein